MNRLGKNMSLAARISGFIVLATVFGLVMLWMITATLITRMIRNNITNQMTDAVEARAAIINNYVTEVEQLLVTYSLNSEIRELLLDQHNAQLQQSVQQYTVEFAEATGIFEGLYVADIYTRPLAHKSEAAIGKGTREGQRLKDLQDTMMRKHGITNVGIMLSPTTGKMVISMYYPLFEKNECIGYVGGCRICAGLDGFFDGAFYGRSSEYGIYFYQCGYGGLSLSCG